mgnify:CR=1 FL=1
MGRADHEAVAEILGGEVTTPAARLVGASNSTRKWYARVDLLKALYGEETKTWDRRRAKRELVDWSNNLFHSEAIRLYEAARRSNRVGQKMRPCPGCIGCCLWVLREKKPGQFVGRWVPRDEPRGLDPEYDQAIWQILDLMNAGLPMDRRIDLQPVCDDSGTLPAGKPRG